MTHPLEGARLKVSRAQEHLNSLQVEIGVYLEKHPPDIVTKANPDNTWTHAVKVIASPPVRLSIIVGDCVTSARAALDYIVWELANRYFVPRIDITNWQDRKLASFQVSENATDKNHVKWFRDLANRKIPSLAIDEIKAVQPYQSGDDSLRWLPVLANTDKHRMLLLTIGVLGSVVLGFDRVTNDKCFNYKLEAPGATSVSAEGSRGTGVVFYPHSESVRAVSDTRIVETQPSIYVAWQDSALPREPIDRTLERIVEYVESIVPRFDSYFW